MRPPKGRFLALYLRSAPYAPVYGVVTATGPKRTLIRIYKQTRMIPTADIGAWTTELS